MRTTEAGLTLIEAVIAVALMAIVLGLAYPGLTVTSGAISTYTQKARLEAAGEKISEKLVESFRLGQLDEIGPSNTAPYAIVHPPRSGIDLGQIAVDGVVPWQAESVRIQFRQTGTADEHKLRLDINGDGDQKDLFALGVLELVTPAGAKPITHRGRVMLGLPSYEGDVDGDGEDDPLFQVTGRRLDLKLVMVQREKSGEFRKAALAQAIYLRNRQD